MIAPTPRTAVVIPSSIVNDRLLTLGAMRILLPGLLLNVTVGNQLWRVGPVYVGQLIFWPLIVGASLILLLSFPRRGWPVLLVLTVFASRAVGANASEGWIYFLYALPLSLLFLLAGSIVAAGKPDLVYRQLRLYFAFTVPFMILQVAGAGSWTQALNTENTGGDISAIEQANTVYPTLFVPESEVKYAIGQGRPAGFMHSNNILSLAIAFALALQLGRIRSRRVTLTDAIVLAAMVLAMAKIAILTFVLMVTWLLVTGTRVIRARMRGVVILTVFLYACYAVLFPGLFAVQLSLYQLAYSMFVRLADFPALANLAGPVWQLVSLVVGENVRYNYSSETDIGHLSGYAAISNLLPFLLPIAALLFFPFRRGLARVRERNPLAAQVAFLVLLVVVLYPAAVPIWASPLFWFCAGFAFLPLVAFLQPSVSTKIATLVAPSDAIIPESR